MTDWRTLATPVAFDGDRVKGARFVAIARPIEAASAAADAKAALAEVRAQHPDAVHHGFAWRSGPVPDDFGWSDGGEPIGTAGKSILQRIDQIGVVNALVIVSRYASTQKLSTSELAKSYGDTARGVLACAQIVAFVPMTRLTLSFDYALSGPVQGVLAAHHATHEAAEYADAVRLVVKVPSDKTSSLERALRDVSSGRLTITSL